MPTMAEYAASGGYARDAQINKNISLGPSSSSSGSGAGSGISGGAGGSFDTPGYFDMQSGNFVATPPATKPTTNLPSWMGNQYSQVPGTSWYSTNPSNPNATKYNADGSSVASIGYTSPSMNFEGYGTPAQASQIASLNSNPAALSSYMSNALANKQLIPQSSIYSPGGANAAMPMSASQVSVAQAAAPAQSASPNMPTAYSNPFSTPTPGYMQSGDKMPSATPYTKNQSVDAMPIDQQLSYYAKNPQEAQQEIARAQGVGSPAAQSWVNQLQSIAPQIIPQAYNGGSGSGQKGQGTGQNQGLSTQQTATPNNLYKDPYARTPESIAALAKTRIDAILQGGRTAASGALSGAKNAYDYSQQTTQGNRALLQFNNSQRGDQYGGSAREDQFRLQRSQGIEDTAANNQYTAQVAQINQKLADLEAAAPADQQKIIDDLTQIERTTGINVAQLQEQQKNNQFNQQHQQFTEQQAVKQQHIDLANALSKQFGVPVNPTEDPMESYAQVAGIPTVEAKKLALDAANMSFDNAIKKALAENTINKSQADIMHSAQQTAIAQQNANTSAASSANSKNNANQTHLIEVWKATGKAPAGISGVDEGTPYVHAPTTQDKNQAMGKLVSDIDKMTPENRKKFFKEQTSNIIDEHGLAQYNQLYNKYLDKNGDPK